MWDFRIFTLCFWCCGFSFAIVELPKEFIVCKRNDPEMDKCFVDAANKVYPLIKKGNKALGMESIEALQIPPMKFIVGYQQAGLSFAIQLNDCILHHTLDKFTKAHVDLKNGSINIDLLLTDLDVVARHNVSGQILFGNIRSHGRCKVIMHDAVNQVVNDNWQLVYEPHYQEIEEATAPAFQKVLNGLLENVPMDVLFPIE